MHGLTTARVGRHLRADERQQTNVQDMCEFVELAAAPHWSPSTFQIWRTLKLKASFLPNLINLHGDKARGNGPIWIKRDSSWLNSG